MKKILRTVFYPLVIIKRLFEKYLYSYILKHNPQKYASIKYKKIFGKQLNWYNPTNVNEKINWLKFNSDTTLWSKYSDKYAVRDYVKSMGYEENLVKLYGVWQKAEDIEWDSLPMQFVLKTNNGSGDILVCKNKEELNKSEVISKYHKLLEAPFSSANGELHYERIKPCIIAEEMLDASKQPILTSSLIDYKIWCFGGKAFYVWICYNRAQNSAEVATFDLDWNYHPEYSVFNNHYRRAEMLPPRPSCFDEMISMAEKLSTGFPQVRVDLYVVDEKPYFGEMTFTSAGGFMNFYTDEFLEILGSKIEL